MNPAHASHGGHKDLADTPPPTVNPLGRLDTLTAFNSALSRQYSLAGTIVPGPESDPPVLLVSSNTKTVDVGADYDERKGGWYYTWAGGLLGYPSDQQTASKSVAQRLGVASW